VIKESPMPRELTCGEARNLASELLDGGLSEADEAAVKEHVTNCQTCPGLYRAMVIVHERLQGLGADATVPPGLATSLSRAIAGTDG
jgi:predicted anti-sigma-YlaC factor YlaD